MILRSFGSGSSGNCYYFGTQERGVLIDAGISARTIHKYLKEMNLDFKNIMGVLITHDHADHIRAVGTLGERVHLPIYATPLIHEGIDRNYGVTQKLRSGRKFFTKGQPWQLGDMTINTFNISHDSTECVGYVIDFMHQRFMIATDCGEPNAELEEYLRTTYSLAPRTSVERDVRRAVGAKLPLRNEEYLPMPPQPREQRPESGVRHGERSPNGDRRNARQRSESVRVGAHDTECGVYAG